MHKSAMPGLCLILLVLVAPASAQAIFGSGFDDPRIETLRWSDGASHRLRTTLGGHVTVMFSPGEAVETITVTDTAAFQVNVAPQRDSIVVRQLRVADRARMSVKTQLRSYQFDIISGPQNAVAYMVQFSFQPPPVRLASPLNQIPGAAQFSYQLRGDKRLRPARVSDDGHTTRIEWPADQPLPAIFAPNALGEEETVDSYMRGGNQVIDRVYPRLIFRMGRNHAEARRAVVKTGK